MRIFGAVTILAFVLSTQLFTGCSSTGDSRNVSNRAAASRNSNTSPDPNAARDNIEELKMLVSVPFDPEEAVWKESPDKKLNAVLLFTDENTAKLTSQVSRLRAPSPETVPTEDWYPAELISQSEISGGSLNGKSYAADDFFLAPYSAGKLVHVDGTNYFVLQLSKP